VATKVPSTTWLPGSRRKWRSSRGPYCELVSDSATIVIEKTTPAVPIIDPAIITSTLRASSARPS
jgi:hypothetical protein